MLRNNVQYNIKSVDDINEQMLLKKYSSFTPEREYYRPTISYYENDKSIQKSQIEQISLDLLEDSYTNELKMILGKVFNVDKDTIIIK